MKKKLVKTGWYGKIAAIVLAAAFLLGSHSVCWPTPYMP